MAKKRRGFIKNMAEFVRGIAERVLAEDEGGVWRTIKGSPVFIKDGQSVNDALREKFGKKGKGISPSKASRLTALIEKKGGFSYQPNFHTSPKDGYMVSPYKDREKVVSTKGITPNNLVDYVLDNQDLFQNRDHYFGAWKDEDSVYFDVSVKHEDKETAFIYAKKHEQLAIYDIKNNDSIYLEKEGVV
ncbi:MAG: hypothetical protein HQ579_02780 [Candidatus Omnitrophica bacterium]|nr:hypothetical protein [Candidatus Omnitrophota bacterium]